MISESIKRFVEGIDRAYVASSDASGAPHLASGESLSVPDPGRLVFQSWCCSTTLRNVRENPKIAVAVADPATGNGYQFFGVVELQTDAAVLNGYLPEELPGLPQVQEKLSVRVERVMGFSAGAHSDRCLG